MPETSAGIALFRRATDGIELLLAHPGGPYWMRKDDASWSFPKGRVDPGEDALAAARRELREETGLTPTGDPIPLGGRRQPSGKTVLMWALEGDCDPATCSSTTFEMEWPPKSGKKASFPEIDRVAWFTPDEARRKLTKGLVPFVDDLLHAVSR